MVARDEKEKKPLGGRTGCRVGDRKWRLAVLLVVSTLVAATLAGAQEPKNSPDAMKPMPELIWATDGLERPYPLFVSARRALSSPGVLDAKLFSEASRLTLERDVLSQDFSSCGRGFRILGHYDPQEVWTDFSSILADSDFVVLGQVTGIDRGFWASFPGTLFRVSPERWLKSEDTWSEKYLFIPSMDMKLGEKRVCMEDSRFPELPQMHWSVLVSYQDSHGNRKQPLFFVDPAQIIVFSPSGDVSLPQFLEQRQPDWLEKNGEQLIDEISCEIRSSRSVPVRVRSRS